MEEDISQNCRGDGRDNLLSNLFTAWNFDMHQNLGEKLVMRHCLGKDRK